MLFAKEGKGKATLENAIVRYQCVHNKPCPVQDDLYEIFQRVSKTERSVINWMR